MTRPRTGWLDVNALEALSSAMRTLRAQWLRTVLTLFGLVWGTASVIFLTAWGAGTKQMVEAGFMKVGNNLVQVWAGRVGEDFTPAADRRYLWFTREHVEALGQKSKLATLVVSDVSQVFVVSAGQRSMSTNVRGVEPETLTLRGVSIAAGRNHHARDVASRRRVAVLGSQIRRELLGPGGGLGSRVRIAGRSYEVVGFLDEVGTQFWTDGGFDLDRQIWIPSSTLLSITDDYGTGDEIISSILLQLGDRRDFDAFREEIRAILAPILGVSPSDHEAVLIGSPIDSLRKMPIDGMDVILFILAATTLGIGGIGVLSMMLDSVQERRREIGVRLAVGARRRDVLLQFFLETFVITAVGGLAGVALGLAGCFALEGAAVPGRIPAPLLTPQIVATAVLTMTFVGVASGTVPAWRASRVDPSVTLRMD